MSTLIVPVDLTAYCIGTLDAAGPARAFAGGSTDYSNQVSRDRPAFLGLNVSRDPSQAPLWPMEQGVHLHWAMPDALTRAPQGDALRFPALPNRWLVSRIAPDALTSRHWIVQSDLLSDTPPAAGHAPTVPVAVAAANGQPTQRGFRFLGATQVFDAGWSEPASAANAARGLRAQTGADLHAVATGDIAFAAFYPNSRGVFGFHDDLTDLNPGPDGVALLYTVTGWYADPTQDPLRGAPSLAQLQQTLGWTCANADPKADRSLYNGLIQGLVWNPHTRYVDDAPSPIDGDVAIGNHPAEALAAYFRGLNSPATPIYEELLTLYATGLLPGLSAPAPGQLALLEETLHALQFSAQDAGTIYTVTRDDAEAIDLPLPLADALNQLNLLRLAADASAVQVRQARWQLFSAWLRLFSVDSGNQQAALSAFSSQFALQGAIDRHQREADDAVAAQAAAVRALLGSELTLTTAPAPSYRGPAEPVLLLAGDAAAPALRYGGDGRYHPSGYLPCRLADAVLDTVSIGPSTTLRAASYAPLAPPAPNRLPDPAVGALVLEAALLCTAIGARASGLAPAALAADLTAWTEGGAARYYASAQGLPPSAVGVGAWPGANPWCSLAVLWQVNYHPLLATAQAGSAVDYPPRYFTANYLLDPNAPGAIAYQPGADGIHIDPASIDFDSRDPASGTHLYQGLSILSAASADNLRNQLARDLARQPDATLQTIADQLAATDISMQSMTGLNDQLLSRRRSLQLSIGVSATAPLPFRSATSQLQTVVGSLTDIAPLAPELNGAYSGVRAGYFTVSAQVMDPFGRKRPVNIRNTYLAQSLTTQAQGAAVPGVAYAQPRLSQPARLLWRWLAADSSGYDEMNAHPATTPVCGWLLPSHLSYSFFLYNAQGNPLGTIAVRADGGAVLWQSAPGNQGTIDADLQTVMAHENPQLRALALALGGATPQFLRAFWQACDRSAGSISPAAADSQSSLGLLVGRPLALTQTSLRLERQGFADLDQSYAALSGGAFADTDHAIGGIRFPVVIGDLQRLDDGLVGYFTAASGGGYDTGTFYSQAATGADPGVVAPAVDRLTLSPAAASMQAPDAPPEPETKLLMLVDPRAPIHASMGILPTETLGLPADQYEDILAALEFTMPAFPLLRAHGGLSVPLPRAAGYNPSWITEDIDGQNAPRWNVDPDLQPVDAGAIWQYSPQSLTEGWLRLNPDLLQFTLTNAQGAPVVRAGADSALTLTIQNRRKTPIVFTPGQTSGEDQPATGSALYLHLGALVDDANVPDIRYAAPGWRFLPLQDARYGQYWAAVTEANLTLPPGASLSIAISQLKVSATAPAQARVYFDYDNLQGSDDGIDMAVLTVQPASAQLT